MVKILVPDQKQMRKLKIAVHSWKLELAKRKAQHVTVNDGLVTGIRKQMGHGHACWLFQMARAHCSGFLNKNQNQLKFWNRWREIRNRRRGVRNS
jgi:hypothetical protein